MKNKKFQLFLVVLFLFVGFWARLYRFSNPIADWHSWRQADTSAVSRNFVNEGFNFLYPKFDDLSNVPSGISNPQGYRFVEFPIFNALQAGGSVTFSSFTLEEWGRLVSIIASLCSSLFLYALFKKRFNFSTGFLVMAFYLLLPFSIYYSRTILPDSLMVFFSLGGIYFFDKALVKNKIFNLSFLLSLTLTALAFLTKPYALFFALPILYLVYEKYGFSFLRKWQLWLYLILSILPLLFWRMWISQFPEGIPVSDWLFNGGDIRFKGSFFYWIFAERIGKLILGFWGVALLILGFLEKNKKNDTLFPFSFALSSLAYLFVIARGNVQHDYYQILIIPSISIYLGLGSAFLLKNRELFGKLTAYLTFLILISFTFFFSWYFVRDYFNINNRSIIAAGLEIDDLIPKDAKIIATYNGDTSFLYQTKRKGWASFEKSLPEMVQMGASYLVIPNPTDEDLEIGEEYKIINATEGYVLFDLLSKP